MISNAYARSIYDVALAFILINAFEVFLGIYLPEMKYIPRWIHRDISDITRLHKLWSSRVFNSHSKGPTFIPYHSNRLLPLVVVATPKSGHNQQQ
jgi:hypothetical protein